MTCISRSPRSGRSLGIVLVLPVAALAVLTVPANAQTRGYYSTDPNVVVDLSALGGPGNEPIATAPLPAPGAAQFVTTPSGMQFPPPTRPQSQLVGRFTTLAAPQLRRPTPQADPLSGQAPVSRLIAPPPAPESLPVAPVRAAPAPAKEIVQTSAKPAPKPPPTVAKAPATNSMAAASPASVPTPPTPPKIVAAPEPAAPAPTAPKPAQLPAKPAEVPIPAVPATQTASAAPAKSAAPIETASLSQPTALAPAPSATESPDGLARILFDSGSAKLPDAARDALLPLIEELNEDGSARVQLEAYAKGTNDTASQARRLSLSRALAVRSFLIEQGIRSTRMDVRALGNKTSSPPAPPDRVDAKLVQR